MWMSQPRRRRLDSVGDLGRCGLADGSPGAQALDVVLVKVFLERRRWSRGCALAGGQLAEAFDVDGDGGEHVLEVSLGLASVAAVAHAVAAGELADGALDAGPDGVALVPGGVLLVGAVAELQFVQFSRGEAHGALAVAGGGAGGPGGAGLALALGEAGDDERGGVGRGGRVGAVPPVADLALRAGDLLAVEVDAEVVAGIALLGAVLAGGLPGSGPVRVTWCSRPACSIWTREV
jgi:hypothetical protein